MTELSPMARFNLHVCVLLLPAWHSDTAAWTAGPSRCSTESARQMWTPLQHHGLNHLKYGLRSNIMA